MNVDNSYNLSYTTSIKELNKWQVLLLDLSLCFIRTGSLVIVCMLVAVLKYVHLTKTIHYFFQFCQYCLVGHVFFFFFFFRPGSDFMYRKCIQILGVGTTFFFLVLFHLKWINYYSLPAPATL
jgi:hypothetical protein